MLLREIKNIFHTELDGHYEREEVGSFFYLLIDHYLSLERFVLAMQPDLVISKEQETPLFTALSRLKLFEPVQHIIGVTDFMDMEFSVTKEVLIPRPETEELVRWVIDYCTADTQQDFKILDIGTGSGCIAISLAKHLLNATVYALDVSKNAIAVATKNAVSNEVDITFTEADILKCSTLDVVFDLIVSNPPYVRELEKNEMQQNVLNHEPDLALFVSDENPLLFYKKITEFAQANLKIGGALFFEINQYLAKETKQLFHDYNFSEIELRKDMFGNDRMLKGVTRNKS